MTDAALIEMLIAMRNAQRHHEKTKSAGSKDIADSLARKIDAEIDRRDREQPTLF